MWLTGFDAPSVNTMYVDRPMHGHNLMQAIARVNRVFRDKDGGLIVDYIGIADSLNQALRHYSKNDRDQAGINVDKAVSLMKSKYDIIINDYLYGVNYSGYNSDIRGKRQESYRLALDAVVSLDKEQQKSLRILWCNYKSLRTCGNKQAGTSNFFRSSFLWCCQKCIDEDFASSEST